MRLARADTVEMLARLAAAVEHPEIPPGAARKCRTLIDRLRRPIRVGLFGLPGVGKTAILNGILGTDLVAPGLALPTFEVAYGREPLIKVTRGDGIVVVREGEPDARLLREDPVFLRIETPLDALREVSFLNLVTSAAPAEIAAALAWAARRSDIALWCSRSWGGEERGIWDRAPEALRNHAALVLTEGAAKAPEYAPGFDRVIRVAPKADEAGATVAPDPGLEALWSHVRDVIEDGRGEDLDAALMLLHRHDRRRGGAGEAPIVAARVPQPVEPARVTEPDTTQAEDTPDIPAGALASLSRVFHMLRQSATGLLESMPSDPRSEEAATFVLEAVEQAFETILGMFETDPELGETWPDLNDAVLEAHETALLLRIEGGAEQAAEAAALLLQIRRETEAELAT